MPLLLVEDNPDDARIILQALGELRVTGKMIHAPGVEQALGHLQDTTQERPALILLAVGRRDAVAELLFSAPRTCNCPWPVLNAES